MQKTGEYVLEKVARLAGEVGYSVSGLTSVPAFWTQEEIRDAFNRALNEINAVSLIAWTSVDKTTDADGMFQFVYGVDDTPLKILAIHSDTLYQIVSKSRLLSLMQDIDTETGTEAQYFYIDSVGADGITVRSYPIVSSLNVEVVYVKEYDVTYSDTDTLDEFPAAVIDACINRAVAYLFDKIDFLTEEMSVRKQKYEESFERVKAEAVFYNRFNYDMKDRGGANDV